MDEPYSPKPQLSIIIVSLLVILAVIIWRWGGLFAGFLIYFAYVLGRVTAPTGFLNLDFDSEEEPWGPRVARIHRDFPE